MEIKTLNGYNMYDMASMLQKAIRRCDIPHAAYAAEELMPSFRPYLWRRMVVISAEDCYGIMTKEIIALWEADQEYNKDKKSWTEMSVIFIAKALLLLCLARKNRDADYVALNFMWNDRLLTKEELDEFVDSSILDDLQHPERIRIPDYVFDKHTILGKRRGKDEIDFFRDEIQQLRPHQESMFDDGDFGGWHRWESNHGGIAPRTEARYQEFAKGKETDPTHNGEDLTIKEPNWGSQKIREEK